jgi:hypothetical protein
VRGAVGDLEAEFLDREALRRLDVGGVDHRVGKLNGLVPLVQAC